ncbi:phosphomannose isomerase type I [Zopfochytrium polystomum]|nr:phosphomannose isomerase type I [Zopfochytrium polystomum]
MHRLEYATQSYDWGKLGRASKVAELLISSSNTPIASDLESTPYAELWMGTHPNGPSTLCASGTPLKSFLSERNVSSGVWSKYGGDLPFLFKVLSIGKALSIQAHPDKILAASLHQQYPKVYKDPNHKPEMALALTPFEALIGFRPLEEIRDNLERYPELARVVGDSVSTAFVQTVNATAPTAADPSVNNSRKAALKSLFKALMESDEALMKLQLRALIKRVKDTSTPSALQVGSIEELLIRVDTQYPDDVGTFCALLLNYIKMEPGDSVFLAANEPHAYISGDCIECMAASDNVVRSGLTPKFKDVKTLVEMLTYKHGSAKSQLMSGEKLSPYTVKYDPPIEEFTVLRTVLPAGQKESQKPIAGPAVVIVTDGEGTLKAGGSDSPLQKGFAFFLEAGTPVDFVAGGSALTIFTAFCEV